MRIAPVGDIDIAYDSEGNPDNPTLVLIAGLGAQLISWDDSLCAELARTWHVVRFDNRDSGLSTHLSGTPDFPAIERGDYTSVTYRLADMAADTIGLLDHLDLSSAHLLGVSMGGMIAQVCAISHPTRTTSLASVMSTPGPAVAPPTPEAAAGLVDPPICSADDAADQAVAQARALGSPGFPLDEERVRRRARQAYERAYHPAGVARQLGAIMASGDRTAALARVTAPTLVVHGTDDPLIGPAGGHATAAAIPDATLALIDGMAHDLPPQVFPRLLELLQEHRCKAT